MRETFGRPSRWPTKLSSMRPPRIAVWPLATRRTLSISRVRVSGMRLSIDVPGIVPRSDGIRILHVPMMLVMVGRTFSVTTSLSLIWAVRFMMSPTGTTFCVVVKVVVETLALVLRVAP